MRRLGAALVIHCGISPRDLPGLQLPFILSLIEARHDADRNRERLADQRLAELLAIIANCHRDPKTKPEPFLAADFLPAPESQPPSNDVDDVERLIFDLGGMFTTNSNSKSS